MALACAWQIAAISGERSSSRTRRREMASAALSWALEALMCLAIAGVALLLERRGRLPRQRFTLYMLLYAVGRFGLEFLRGDEIRGALGPLSTSQWISLLLLLCWALYLVKNARKA